MTYKYCFDKYDKNIMCRTFAENSKISTKKSVEVLKRLKGKKIKTAISYIENVMNKKVAMPYTKYFQEMGHKPGKGISVGGYPVKVCEEVLRLLNNLLASVKEKNLEVDDVKILIASARQGNKRYHPGRYQGRKFKATNLEIICHQISGDKKK